jgi:hypothetical protein
VLADKEQNDEPGLCTWLLNFGTYECCTCSSSPEVIG